jgi:TPR repeat protein
MKNHSWLALLTVLVCLGLGVCHGQQAASSDDAMKSQIAAQEKIRAAAEEMIRAKDLEIEEAMSAETNFILCRKAADQGNAAAQYKLGVMYQNGQGVEKDDSKAFVWFGKAAEQGNAAAKVVLCRRAADQGDAAAQFRLGLLYDTGPGSEQDHAEAIKWYSKSAEQGDATAQSKLIYEATVQGDVAAQCSLGVMSENGRGVAKDFVEAAKWYRKAAVQGDAIAQCRIGWMHQNGQGVTKDAAAAAKWYHLRVPSSACHDCSECLPCKVLS